MCDAWNFTNRNNLSVTGVNGMKREIYRFEFENDSPNFKPKMNKISECHGILSMLVSRLRPSKKILMLSWVQQWNGSRRDHLYTKCFKKANINCLKRQQMKHDECHANSITSNSRIYCCFSRRYP